MFICLSTRTVLKCFDNLVFNRILQKPKNPDLSLYIIMKQVHAQILFWLEKGEIQEKQSYSGG